MYGWMDGCMCICLYACIWPHADLPVHGPWFSVQGMRPLKTQRPSTCANKAQGVHRRPPQVVVVVMVVVVVVVVIVVLLLLLCCGCSCGGGGVVVVVVVVLVRGVCTGYVPRP